MIRSLWLLGVYLAFLGLGMGAPFVLTLGYVWVDTFRPQSVAFIGLNQVPVAMIMGVMALGGYLAFDRRSPPRITLLTVLTLIMAGWVTTTLLWAEDLPAALEKWDWAFKTVLFSAFIPVVVRSRVQIEAFAQTYVFSLAANFLPFGFKVLMSGGGYGRNLGLEGGNSMLAEGGLLSTICLMAIPLALFLSRHTLFFPRTQWTRFGYYGVCILALVTALGTYERSALIGITVLGTYLVINSKRKLLFGLVALVIGGAIFYQSSSAWTERMSTISQVGEDESGTLTRLLVWQWTLGYATTHPFGGGFQSFVVDRIEFPSGNVQFARAFHSIWFEMLGEHGWPGLGLFITIGLLTLRSMGRVIRRTRKIPELEWCADLAGALRAGLLTFFASGTFVGIGFQPAFWYFVAVGISLSEYVRRVEAPARPTTGWRAQQAQLALGIGRRNDSALAGRSRAQRLSQ